MHQALSAFGAGTWSSEHGEFISDAHRQLAEVVNDYNPNLYVAHVPREQGGAMEQFPFAIIEHRSGQEPEVIRYITTEQMMEPQKILAWIFEGDLIRHSPLTVLARMEAEDRAKELLKLKAWEEEQADREEQVAFFATGGREKHHTIRHNGKKFER